MIVYLFDIDGTLVRAGGAGARALSAVFHARYGVADACRGIAAAGRTDPAIVTDMFTARLGREPAAGEIDAVIDAYLGELDRELARGTMRVLPDAASVLGWLGARAGVRLTVATGNVREGARLKLAHAGLADRFELDTGGYGCDSADRPALVARAVERSGAGAGDTVVVVGDTVHDVHAARAVGAVCVAVTTGDVPRDVLDAAGADVVFDGLAPIVEWHAARFAP